MMNIAALGLCVVGIAAACNAADRPATTQPAFAPRFFANLAAGKRQTVVTYGTSVTEYGPWVGLMVGWFDAQFPGQVSVVNSGGSGQNSRWGVENLKSRVLDERPDLVFIEFSINDAVTRFNLPVEEGVRNLDRMVQSIRAWKPDTEIILQTMNSTWDTPDGGTAGKDRSNLAAYVESYRQYAREHRLPLIDNYPDWVKLQKSDPAKFKSYIPDGRHPNKDGAMAVTWPNLKSALERSVGR